MRTALISLAIVGMLLLAACGQRGALYFPGEPAEPAASPPVTMDHDEDQDDD